MKSRMKMLVAALAVTVLAACGSSGGGNNQEKVATSFAAAVDGSDAFVGVVVDGADDRVMAYVCDGKSVASWFTGKAGDDGSISLSSPDGVRLAGRIADDRLTGTLILPNGGAAQTFAAREVATPAGLYRSRTQLNGESAVGGWVVLEDGRQRGAVRTSTGIVSSDSSLARPDRPVTSFTDTSVDF